METKESSEEILQTNENEFSEKRYNDILNKDGEIKKTWDYINYLKVSGPKKVLSEFEEMFTIDGYPTLNKLLPVPEGEEMKRQLKKMLDDDIEWGVTPYKEYDEDDWYFWNWGISYDINKYSTRVYGVKGKNKIFTVFNSEPIYQWLVNIQIKYPTLTFLTYYRSSSRNLWAIWKTIRKDGIVELKHQGGDYSDISFDADNIMKHEQVIQNIIHFDDSFRPVVNNFRKIGFSRFSNMKSHVDFE